MIRNLITKRNLSTNIPKQPTWDLIPLNKTKKVDNVDLKKLEKLSMLTIDSQTEDFLNDSINVAERMSNIKINYEIESSIYYQYLGTSRLREDDEKLYKPEESEQIREKLLKNSSYKYEEYFVAPPSKPN